MVPKKIYSRTRKPITINKYKGQPNPRLEPTKEEIKYLKERIEWAIHKPQKIVKNHFRRNLACGASSWPTITSPG